MVDSAEKRVSIACQSTVPRSSRSSLRARSSEAIVASCSRPGRALLRSARLLSSTLTIVRRAWFVQAPAQRDFACIFPDNMFLAFGLCDTAALTLAFGVLSINIAAGDRVGARADIPSRAGHSKGLGIIVSVGGIALTLI